MIKAVIFDMDGLMFDTERVVMKSWDYSGEQLGYGKLGSSVYHTMGLTTESTREYFTGKYGKEFPYDTFRKIGSEFAADDIAKNGVPVKDGLMDLLKFLKDSGFKAAVATSTRSRSAMGYFESLAITGYFDTIVCGDMITHGKPDPEIYLKASGQLGVPPEECMVLEDSPYGITAAFRAGMKPVMIPDLVQPEHIQKMLYARLNSLTEVIGLLSGEKPE
jgi:HAD superfamily hydrolase (TIGR01509 family)